MSIDKSAMSASIEKIQGMVKDFPATTPQICRLVVDYFLEIMQAYQAWVVDLQRTIVEQDGTIKKLKSTVDTQIETLKKVYSKT